MAEQRPDWGEVNAQLLADLIKEKQILVEYLEDQLDSARSDLVAAEVELKKADLAAVPSEQPVAGCNAAKIVGVHRIIKCQRPAGHDLHSGHWSGQQFWYDDGVTPPSHTTSLDGAS